MAVKHVQRIVFFLGGSQYDLLFSFTDNLSSAVRRLGHEAVVIDLVRDPRWLQKITGAFSRPCTAFGFNGIGFELRTPDGRSLYDALKIPFIAALVDHPIYHMDVIKKDIRDVTVACVDHTHIRFIREQLEGCRPAFFLPHAGTPVSPAIPAEDGSEGNAERDIDVLFSGSIEDPDKWRRKWKSFPPVVAQLCDEIAETALADASLSLEEITAAGLRARGMAADQKIFLELLPGLMSIDRFIRAHRRVTCLKKLSDSGIHLHIYGSVIEKSPLKVKENIVFHGPVSFSEVLSVMARSKIVLNTLPYFPEGSHERVFSAMLNGALCISDSNRYLAKEFNAGKEILFYSWQQLDDLPGMVREMLTDNNRRLSIAAAGREKVKDRHTWKHRAGELLTHIESLK
ncbi:MAG: glycosyltransferase family 1 protein [bacterium]|nr:glycosyltransferase family 1 protein [bacterium]